MGVKLGRSFSLRKERRMKFFDNRVRSRIFGPKRDKVTGEWRILHNVYCSPNVVWMIKSRLIGWARQVARTGYRRGAYRFLVGRPGGKRLLERPRLRWEDNITMEVQELTH